MKHIEKNDLTTTWAINTSGDIWTLANNASITVSKQPAILLSPSLNGNTININGDIFAKKIESAVDVDASFTAINVGSSSEIHASNFAFSLRHSDTVVRNKGLIEAGNTGIDASAQVSIFNDGEINSQYAIHSNGNLGLVNNGELTGEFNGVLAAANGASITNGKNGVITGNQAAAIYITDTGNYQIVNNGVLKGHGASLLDAAGDGTIVNHGTMNGDVSLGAGDDIFDTRGGVVHGKIMGGQGYDTFIVDSQSFKLVEAQNQGTDLVKSTVDHSLEQNIENLTLIGKANVDATGNGLDNVIFGNAGKNVLKGLEGEDLLFGGRGDDRLVGGVGSDYFDFTPNTGHDVVVDFIDGEDYISSEYAKNEEEIEALIKDHASTSGSDTLITFGDDTLLIKNLALANLTEEDFKFLA